jgi:hypothetical protein
MATTKQLEKKLDGLQAKREKLCGELAKTHASIADTYLELQAAPPDGLKPVKEKASKAANAPTNGNGKTSPAKEEE